MTKRKPYKTCRDCGANLDPGEHCDCWKAEQPDTKKPDSPAA